VPDFKINFGNAKQLTPFELPPEGQYTLVIADYKCKEAKNPESRAKGFNIAIVFNVADDDYPGAKLWHNLWVAYENPWAAKYFFDALTGKDLEDDNLDVTDADSFIGQAVGAALIHESYEYNGETRKKLVVATPDSFYNVPF